MTTVIATREGVWADSRTTGGGPIGSTPKVFRVGRAVVGIAGTLAACAQAIQWIQDPLESTPPDWEQCKMLMVNAEGIWMFEGIAPYRLDDRWVTMGSGEMPAMAALYMGATPTQAIKVAAKCDEATGGNVKYLKLRQTAKPRLVQADDQGE